jgi:hypothetical protein
MKSATKTLIVLLILYTSLLTESMVYTKYGGGRNPSKASLSMPSGRPASLKRSGTLVCRRCPSSPPTKPPDLAPSF